MSLKQKRREGEQLNDAKGIKTNLSFYQTHVFLHIFFLSKFKKDTSFSIVRFHFAWIQGHVRNVGMNTHMRARNSRRRMHVHAHMHTHTHRDNWSNILNASHRLRAIAHVIDISKGEKWSSSLSESVFVLAQLLSLHLYLTWWSFSI